MEKNSSIFPAYFSTMTAEERAAITADIEKQKKTADRWQLLKLDFALKAMQEIWNEEKAP